MLTRCVPRFERKNKLYRSSFLVVSKMYQIAGKRSGSKSMMVLLWHSCLHCIGPWLLPAEDSCESLSLFHLLPRLVRDWMAHGLNLEEKRCGIVDGLWKGDAPQWPLSPQWSHRSYAKLNQKVQGGAGWIQGGRRTAIVAVSSKDKLKRYPTHQNTILKRQIWKGDAPQWPLSQTKKMELQASAKKTWKGGAPQWPLPDQVGGLAEEENRQ